MSEEPRIILHDDCQLLDWGESRATGAWIKLRLSDPHLLDVFRGMDTATMKRTGHIISCTLAEGDITQLAAQEQKTEVAIHGGFWRDLIRSGFFRAPKVLESIAPEREYEAWVRGLPSVLDGGMDWDPDRGEYRCECCHVRRVSEGSGTGKRPPYFAVPMTHEQHECQHRKGENAVMARFSKVPEEGAENWFCKTADRLRSEWASSTLAKKLVPHCRSRAEVSPDMVRSWVESMNLMTFMPNRLRK